MPRTAKCQSVPGLCGLILLCLCLTLLTGIQANDDGVDFFSRTGTDHHFHFGYWVVAAAAVAAVPICPPQRLVSGGSSGRGLHLACT